MRIFVTGSAGFIGSNLVDKLLADGHSVVGMDNLITGNRKNFAHLSSNPNFEFIEHDITKPFPPLEGSFDVLFNLACPASPIDYQNIPLETLWVCAMGTKNVLDLAVEHGALFLHASTSEVYGDPLIHPQTETYWGNVNPIGPRSCYDEGKRFAESLIVNYGEQHGLDVRMFRIFNTYGPRMRANDGRVIPNFINQALNNEPITVYGDGSQTRSFCYVDDLVNGIVDMMNADKVDTPLNLGNPKETTILELAEMVVKQSGSKSEITFKDLPLDDPKVRQPDLTKTQAEIGFSPEIKLETGLQKTIDFFYPSAN